MEENTGVGIRVAAGIFLTIMLITIVVIITISSQDAAKQGQTKMAAITTQLSDTEYQTYSNTTLSGSQVLNAIRQYMNQEQFGIKVITGKEKGTTIDTQSQGVFYGSAFNTKTGDVLDASAKNVDLTNAENQFLPNYINPSGKFKSSIVRDKNNMIRGIIFIQE
ncbi:ABC transporter permease [Paenibacillus silvae]|uniref:ABC transporter permease n=1 Tax=Paenibacillus silvae TaxID=1325358 RepID=UPI0020048E2F|nr:ABC transporter permease [Paenibacillus silvae]MCK6078277.1 ABC transporter permease [Paenibacillus silvae]MCK6150473.1 ABC transporter permease [Paenibacillus silvae]MCK6270326.1 ABC transporter permease [Paenibacillus silvae]